MDTNAVIEYLNNSLPESIATLFENDPPHISTITRIELLAWPNATESQTSSLRAFIDASVVYAIDEPVIVKTIEIRKKFRVKLPDAMIAATALIYDRILITRNITDFNRIPGLQLQTPV